jgi:uncharacterized protein
VEWKIKVTMLRESQNLKAPRVLRIAAVACGAMLVANVAMSKDNRPSKAEVVELLRLSGSDNITKELIPLISMQFVLGLRRLNNNVSEGTEEEIRGAVGGYLDAPAQQTKLLDHLVPIYLNRFSEMEVRQLIAFYRTPVGRKWTATLPQINGEVAQAGQAWATEIMPGLKNAVFARLHDRGSSAQ